MDGYCTLANHGVQVSNNKVMKKCFLSTYHHPSFMVRWYVLVHFGPLLEEGDGSCIIPSSVRGGDGSCIIPSSVRGGDGSCNIPSSVISVSISLNPLLHIQGRDKSFCLFVCLFGFFGGCVSEYLPLGD
jgi:hypothetical protein